MKTTREIGLALETYICEQLREKGLDLRAKPSFNSGATTSDKSDIYTSAMFLNQNIGIEAKHQATFCIPEWWKQTQKLVSLHREPVLVFKHPLEPFGETKALLYLDSLLELLKENKDLKTKLSTFAKS